MPKLEIKQVYAELDAGKAWPCYWIYGPERMKSRELLKRLELALGKAFENSINRESLDGAESNGDRVVEAAQSLSLLARLQLVIVRDAHQLKELDALRGLWGLADVQGAARPIAELPFVCVLLAKDLDGRKKISKELVQNAAVIECTDVPEAEREAWIRFLLKRRGSSGVAASPELTARLVGMDPWSLDLIDQELEKLTLLRWGLAAEVDSAGAGADAATDAAALWQESLSGARASSQFLDAYLARNSDQAMALLPAFVNEADEVFPLLGLLAWNLRQIAQISAGSAPRLGPWIQERLARVAQHWNLPEVRRAQRQLLEMDLALKQKPLEPIGVWSGFVLSTQA